MPGMVAAIVDVELAGCTLPLDHFHVENGHIIVRDGHECWPACLDLRLELRNDRAVGGEHIAEAHGVRKIEGILCIAGRVICRRV